MNQLTTQPADITMSSLDFLNSIVNPSRASAGEPVVSKQAFIGRVEDELDLCRRDAKIYISEEINNLGFKVQRESKYYDLTMDQMMLVGMRESKAVRKSVLNKLKAMETERGFQSLLPVSIPTVDEIRKATAVLAARDSAVTYLQNKIVELGGAQVEQAPVRAVRNSHGPRPSKLLLGDDVASRALDAIKAIPVRLKNPSTGEMFTGDIGEVLIHCRNNKTQWTEGLSRYGIRVEGEEVWIGTGDTAVCHALAKEFGDRSIGRNAILSIDGARRLDKTVKFAGQVCRVTAVSLNEFVRFF